jgi:N-acetylglucosaminyl-diphospho-decaprenol L-rhamnosyltransferase
VTNPPAGAPRASVVIVTYNSAEMLPSCLASLGDAHSPGIELIVVDNASGDQTSSRVRAEYPYIQIIQNEVNLGFAKAVNIGAAAARGEYIVLLNPDATLRPGVLTSLMEEADQSERIGVIAPLLSDPAGRLRIGSAGRDPSTWRMFCHYFGLSRMLGRFPMFEGHYLLSRHLTSSREVDWVTGACMVVSRRVWHALGGLSERWFMYAEDMEFCHRVRESGYLVVVNPALSATHLVGESTSGNVLSPDPAWVVNLYDYYACDIASSRPAALLWRLVVSGGLLLRAFVYRIRSITNPSRRHLWALESARFASFADGALRAPGRLPRDRPLHRAQK